MDQIELTRIINVVTKECRNNFKKFASSNVTLGGKEVILFYEETTLNRKIGDSGTEEDTDQYIWYSQKGWETSKQITQTGAGVRKLVEQESNNVNINNVIEIYLKMNIIKKLEFLSNCNKIISLSEFKYELYKINIS